MNDETQMTNEARADDDRRCVRHSCFVIHSSFGFRHSSFRASGFTLLELVMVMMLLCVVAAMATPALRGFSEGRKVGTCAAQLVSAGYWARTQAVTRGVSCRLNVDTSTNSFWLTVDQGAGVFVTPGEEFGRVFTAPDGVTLRWFGQAPMGSQVQQSQMPSAQGQASYVEFLPTGRTTAAAWVEVSDTKGSVVEVGCRSPGEPLRVLADWERGLR